MQALRVQASPNRLATLYALLIGGANALGLVASLSLAGRSNAVFDTVLTLVSWAVTLGSLFLIVHLGYVAATVSGTMREAVEAGLKAGTYLGVQLVIGTTFYLVISGQLLTAGPDGWATRIASTIVRALTIIFACALVAVGLALLGAAVARKRARA